MAAKKLLSLTQPILLQRKKTDKDEHNQHLLQLPSKTEFAVWMPLSTQQRELYTAYLKHKKENSCDSTLFPVEIIGHLRCLARYVLCVY